MALDATDWLLEDPHHDSSVRELIKEITDHVTRLAETASGAELEAIGLEMVRLRDWYLSNEHLASSAHRVHARRTRATPEPAGVEWACASGLRAADVVEACRKIVKKKTGLHGRAWPWEIAQVMPKERSVYISVRVWNRWRRGEEPVDRDVVVAALKLAMVEDARELAVKGLSE